ncbi:MAG: Gx transporter family protein [Calditrichaeota bacterium]|nr:Gx transporter family protein [Calditrichota bacterium]
MRRDSLKKWIILSLLTASGLLLFGIESFLPQPLPGGKIGLSHIATLLALYLFDVEAAFWVVLLRIFITALLFGGFFNPVFYFALTGGVLATAVMGVVKTYGRGISIVGNSILGAFTHNTSQLILAYFLFVRSGELFWLFPYLTLVSIVSGTLIGVLSKLLLDYIIKIEEKNLTEANI